MRLLQFILVGFLGIVIGISAGMVVAYALPEGFPGAEGPPADQKQVVLAVEPGKLESNEWVGDVKVFLCPIFGIRGDRSYSVLIFVPKQGERLNATQATALYLEAKDMDLVQPVEIDAPDLVELAAGRIVVKLLDEGPNSAQYYSSATSLTLNSQP